MFIWLWEYFTTAQWYIEIYKQTVVTLFMMTNLKSLQQVFVIGAYCTVKCAVVTVAGNIVSSQMLSQPWLYKMNLALSAAA